MNRRSSLAALMMMTVALVCTGCHRLKDATAAAERAVAEFHQKFDAGDFHGLYEASHKDFKDATTEKDFAGFLQPVHRKLGNVQSTERISSNIDSHNSQNVVITFKTKFAEGEGTESFNYHLEGDHASLVRYGISSKALISK